MESQGKEQKMSRVWLALVRPFSSTVTNNEDTLKDAALGMKGLPCVCVCVERGGSQASAWCVRKCEYIRVYISCVPLEACPHDKQKEGETKGEKCTWTPSRPEGKEGVS